MNDFEYLAAVKNKVYCQRRSLYIGAKFKEMRAIYTSKLKMQDPPCSQIKDLLEQLELTSSQAIDFQHIQQSTLQPLLSACRQANQDETIEAIFTKIIPILLAAIEATNNTVSQQYICVYLWIGLSLAYYSSSSKYLYKFMHAGKGWEIIYRTLSHNSDGLCYVCYEIVLHALKIEWMQKMQKQEEDSAFQEKTIYWLLMESNQSQESPEEEDRCMREELTSYVLSQYSQGKLELMLSNGLLAHLLQANSTAYIQIILNRKQWVDLHLQEIVEQKWREYGQRYIQQ